MKGRKALETAKGLEGQVARPVEWRGQARGYTYCPEECGWLLRDYRPEDGRYAYQIKPARSTGELDQEWETVPVRLLRVEAEDLHHGGRG